MNACVQRLARLIAYHTENPGGDEVAICSYLAGELRARGCDAARVVRVPRTRDSRPQMGAYVFARWGTPRTLVNVHVDTVPANTGWTADPWTARVSDGRVVGLGAADTKGAIAALLTALDRRSPRDFGVLFSGDEERGGTCIRAFLASEDARAVERAIVCEPTGRLAGVRHRGIVGQRARVAGRGGHSSAADRLPKPIVTLAHLAIALDDLGRAALDDGPDDMKGICLNVASLDGGVAFNVVPDAATLTWSLRPPPGFDMERWRAAVRARAAAIDPAIDIDTFVDNPPFDAGDTGWIRTLLGNRVRALAPLQFWTEAAEFVRAGMAAVVVGPGAIEQAHAADEYVTVDDLEWAVDLFAHVLEQARAPE